MALRGSSRIGEQKDTEREVEGGRSRRWVVGEVRCVTAVSPVFTMSSKAPLRSATKQRPQKIQKRKNKYVWINSTSAAVFD